MAALCVLLGMLLLAALGSAETAAEKDRQVPVVVITVTLTPAPTEVPTAAPSPSLMPSELPFPTETPAPVLVSTGNTVSTADPAEEKKTPEEKETPDPNSTEIYLSLRPKSETSFTNALQHYVYFDAEIQNAQSLSIRVWNPQGQQNPFRTRFHVDRDYRAVKNYSYPIKKGQESYEDLNVLFPSDAKPGTWIIEVTASAKGKADVVRKLEIQISEPVLNSLPGLGKARAMLIGLNEEDVVPVQEGKIRFIAQNPKDERFIRGYWFNKAYDLREKANSMCTRAVFSMALSWLGIDCTPVRMSEIMRNDDLFYTYDEVCEKLGNVTRVTGDLETLWATYEAGEASPVLVHFKYSGGMHAVLLIARDEDDPQLYYAVTTSTPVNTAQFADGRNKDVIIPIIIEKGEEGQQIQSPLFDKYHKGRIDQLWNWTKH